MTIPRFVIKTFDLMDYGWNRSKLLLNYHAARARGRAVLGGRVESILVVRFGSLGDVVRSTIVLDLLHGKYPGAAIDVLTSAGCVRILEQRREINRIYTPAELESLPGYDWIINLQNPDPLPGFLAGTPLDYPGVLRFLSEQVPHRFMTGRRYSGGKEVRQTDIQYCTTEVEEILLTALLPAEPQPLPRMVLDLEGARQRVLQRMGGKWEKPPVGVFFGAVNDIDRGTRSFSLDYLARLTDALSADFTPVVFGQSKDRPGLDPAEYRRFLAERPAVVDLVDRTDLEELMALISVMQAIVSTDSSPIHLAMGLGVPLVGLYGNSSRFRISPVAGTDKYRLFDAFPPCFTYSYRWKFFCSACMEKHSEAYRCHQKEVPHAIERIAVEEIAAAVRALAAR